MPITVFFDSSGKSSDGSFVVLSGLALKDSAIDPLSEEWSRLLQSEAVTAWHTTDAMALRREYSREQGWSVPRVDGLRNRLLNLLSRFKEQAALDMVSCAVDSAAVDHLRQSHPNKVPSVEEICLDHTAGATKMPPEDSSEQGVVSLVFDRNERYLHRIKTVWDKGRKQGVRGWIQQVARIDTASARDCLPLQAADLVAWSVRRTYQRGDEFKDPRSAVTFIVTLLMGHRGVCFREEELIERYIDGRLLKETGAAPLSYRLSTG